MWPNLAEILFMSRSIQSKRQNIFWTKEFCDKIKISIKAIFLKILVKWFLKGEGY